MSRDDDAKVGRLVMQAEPEIIWIATSDEGQSAMASSDAKWWSTEGKRYVEGWVREHPVVHGKPVKLMHWEKWPRYTTDPAADYSVLVRVRETWHLDSQTAFRDALEQTWAHRTRMLGGKLPFHLLAYEVGDYSLAALKAMAETSG